MKANKFITVAAVAFCMATSSFAQTWMQTTAPANTVWAAIASSADGTGLFVSSLGFSYAISTNSGASWNTFPQPQQPNGDWYSVYGSWNCVASSADGHVLIGMNANAFWTSTNSGASWISNNIPAADFFVSVALAADGSKAVAVDGREALGTGGSGGGIYTSTNSGLTWTETTAPTNLWTSVACSADGTVLAAAALGAPTIPVYVSTNSGTTWTPTATPTNINCHSIASSADGRKLILGGTDINVGYTGIIYTSTNYGNTWISNSVPLSYNPWFGVASSADGTRLVAVGQDGGGAIVTSMDSGATWISNNIANQIACFGVASSADGTKLMSLSIGSSSSGGIWTSQTTPSPVLKSELENNCVALSWIIPSTNFVLQQSSDLAGWSDVTNPSVLNLTTLQNQVTLPAPAGNAFFRLKTP